MAFYKYTGPAQVTYPTFKITVSPNDVVDFGVGSPPNDGQWQANAGPANNPAVPVTSAGLPATTAYADGQVGVWSSQTKQFVPATLPRGVGQRFIPYCDSVDIYTDTDAAWASTWPHMYAAMTCGRAEMVKNAGVAGNTTAQMLARFATDVAPNAPTHVAIGNISNDVINNVATATTRANVLAMIAATLTLGAVPVLRTSVPYHPAGVTTAQRQQIIVHNRWLQALAEARNYPFIDFYAAIADPATAGNYLAAYGQPDNIHPTAAGWAMMAAAAFAVLMPAGVPGPVGLAAVNQDPANLLANGLFLTDSNADGLADNWTVDQAPTSGTCTRSIVTDNWMPGKKAQRLTYAAAIGGSGVYQSVASGWSPGDVIEVTAGINLQVPGGYAQLIIQGFGGTGLLVTRLTSVQGRSVLRRTCTLPAGTGGLNVSIDGGISTTAVSGTLDVGGFACRNLTTGQLLNIT